jgi:hypothetical protein
MNMGILKGKVKKHLYDYRCGDLALENDLSINNLNRNPSNHSRFEEE